MREKKEMPFLGFKQENWTFLWKNHIRHKLLFKVKYFIPLFHKLTQFPGVLIKCIWHALDKVPQGSTPAAAFSSYLNSTTGLSACPAHVTPPLLRGVPTQVWLHATMATVEREPWKKHGCQRKQRCRHICLNQSQTLSKKRLPNKFKHQGYNRTFLNG